MWWMVSVICLIVMVFVGKIILFLFLWFLLLSIIILCFLCSVVSVFLICLKGVLKEESSVWFMVKKFYWNYGY